MKVFNETFSNNALLLKGGVNRETQFYIGYLKKYVQNYTSCDRTVPPKLYYLISSQKEAQIRLLFCRSSIVSQPV